ncbi:hypothetical protein EYF80_054192 [Liparis tanakae]|uniref:Uncharacterized protein n=1 Tax=Liparis tanakae TaxID=230148 RepID=A0A4Z2F347_9TELE|nr:hypothetical protein EYF80_054192 [Liparis tanakae]
MPLFSLSSELACCSGMIAQAVLHLLQLSLQMLHPQTVTQTLPLGDLEARLRNLFLSTHKPSMMTNKETRASKDGVEKVGGQERDHRAPRPSFGIDESLPEDLQDLVLRLALLGQGDVQRTLADRLLQLVGHLAAHGLDLLVQEGDPGLQQLGADPLGSLVQLLPERRGLRGLSRGGLQGRHVGRVQDHLTLVLVLRFKRQLSLRNGERRVERIIASNDIERLLLLGFSHGDLLQRRLVVGLSAAETPPQAAHLTDTRRAQPALSGPVWSELQRTCSSREARALFFCSSVESLSFSASSSFSSSRRCCRSASFMRASMDERACSVTCRSQTWKRSLMVKRTPPGSGPWPGTDPRWPWPPGGSPPAPPTGTRRAAGGPAGPRGRDPTPAAGLGEEEEKMEKKKVEKDEEKKMDKKNDEDEEGEEEEQKDEEEG